MPYSKERGWYKVQKESKEQDLFRFYREKAEREREAARKAAKKAKNDETAAKWFEMTKEGDKKRAEAEKRGFILPKKAKIRGNPRSGIIADIEATPNPALRRELLKRYGVEDPSPAKKKLDPNQAFKQKQREAAKSEKEPVPEGYESWDEVPDEPEMSSGPLDPLDPWKDSWETEYMGDWLISEPIDFT